MSISYERGVILVIIILILTICIFAPLNNDDIENFSETYHLGNNLNVNGPLNELNLSSVQSSFPFYHPLLEKDHKVDFIKSDGVVLGGYRPQIIRPFDSVSAKSTSSSCKWPCYSNHKFQNWCSEDNAIRYYAMRPIIQPNEYTKLLKEMFDGIVEVEPEPEGMTSIQVFCTNTQKDIMSFIMGKVALQVSKMPRFNKNSSWGAEQFIHTEPTEIYEYSGKMGRYYRVIFNLYNTYRSISTLVVVTLKKNGPKIISMKLVNEDTHDHVKGVSMSKGIISPEKLDPHEDLNPLNPVDWIYKNTLDDKKFNKHGFYSNNPNENIEIEGGVPDSLKDALKGKCNNTNLMSCVTPNYTGIDSKTNKPATVDGNIKNVYSSPDLIYSRSLESPEGMVYF